MVQMSAQLAYQLTRFTTDFFFSLQLESGSSLHVNARLVDVQGCAGIVKYAEEIVLFPITATLWARMVVA